MAGLNAQDEQTLGRSGSAVRPPRGAGLLGRDREIAELKRCMFRVAPDGAQVLVLEGEPGIGKSALCSFLVDDARRRGFVVLHGRADELEGRRPFGLLAQAFGADFLDAVGARAAAELLAISATAPDRELAAIEVAIELVERHCSERAAVLVLEDLQWADASSLLVLRGLLRRARALPLVLVASTRLAPRSGALESFLTEVGPSRRLAIEAMDAISIEQLAVRRCGMAIGAGLSAELKMTRGNPLFALELLDALFAEGALKTRQHPLGGTVLELEGIGRPPSLRLTVLHRLSFCPPETLQLLSRAAIFGVRFDPVELSHLAMCSVGEVVSALAEVKEAGLLVDDGARLAFRHEVVAAALYNDIPPSLRRALHRGAARLLLGSAPPGVVAEHLMRAMGGPGDEEALAWLIEDARRLAAYAPASAVDLLERALDLLPPGSERRSAAIADLGVAMLWCGRAREGEALCRTALALLVDPTARLSVRQCLGESLLARGRLEALREELDKGAADAAFDPRLGAELDGLASLGHLFLGELEQSRLFAENVEASGETFGIVSLKVQALVIRSLLAEQEANVLEAARCAVLAVSLAEADGSRAAYRPWPHSAAAIYCVDSDRFEDADALLASGRRAHESLGSRHALPVLDVVRGFSLFWSGHFDDAAAQFDAAISLAEETDTGWRAAARGLWAVICLAKGDSALAGRLLEDADAGLASGEAPYRVEWLALARALVLEADGDLEGALGALLPFAERFASWPPPAAVPVAATLARLALDSGRQELASSLCAPFAALAKRCPGVAGFAATADHLTALVSGDLDAFCAALSAYRRAGRLFERAGCGVDAALAFRRSGRDGEATRFASAALADYRRVGAPALSARASVQLGGLVARTELVGQVPGSAGAGWGKLTATEAKVLRLIAERRTNNEIAAALVVSRRTVETHVSHILHKVGLRSRLELAEGASRNYGWQLRLHDDRGTH